MFSMARSPALLAGSLLLLALAALALSGAEARSALRAGSLEEVQRDTGRGLLAKGRKDAKSAPQCGTDADGPECADGGHEHEAAEGGGHAHRARNATAGGELSRAKEGKEHDHGEEEHEEEGEEHDHEEKGEEHDHEEEGEEHDHEEGEEHGHEEGAWGEGGHDHDEHDHGPGADFVALLGEESATNHAFELLAIEEGKNMTPQHIATLLDALNGDAEVEQKDDGHDHGHAHGGEQGDVQEATSWVTADGLLSAYGGGRPVLTAAAFQEACPVIVACQLDPTCALGMNHPEEGEEEEVEEDLLSLKAIAAGALFLEVLLGYAVPYGAQYMTVHLSWYISLLNTFSGGVILATGLVHLVPEVIEEQFEVEIKNEYPLGMVMMTVGFLLVFFVEQVLFAGAGCPHSHGKAANKNDPLKSVQTTARSVMSSDMELKVMQSGKVCTDKAGGLESRSSISTDLASPVRGHQTEQSGLAGFIVTHRNGVILLVALVVHSILEGIVVGLQDERDDVLTLFAAIGAHKVAAAMALSARFLKTGASFLQAFPFLVTFGLAGAASVMTGTVLNSVPAMIHLVLNGLAAGTFVYIGAYEVVQEEFSGAKGGTIDLSLRMQRFVKFMLMLLGVAIISLIGLLPHNHG